MAKLINIAKTEEKPLYIDSSDITAMMINPDKGELSLHNSKGKLLWISMKEWDVDPADALKKLADNGRPLVSFPTRWPAEEGKFKEYPAYVAPEAVTFATVSQPSDNGKVGAIVGLKGYGRHETYDISQEEIGALLKAVRASKTVLEYAPEEAYARWAAPGGLYIDPQSVTRIQDNGAGTQVNVYFGQYGLMAGLDVQVKDVNPNDVMDRLLDENPNRDGREVVQEAYRLEKEEEGRARVAFANTLAAANGNLTLVPYSKTATYIDKKDIGFISFYNDERGCDLVIHVQESPANQYGDRLTFRFNTAAERKKAFEQLTTGEEVNTKPEIKAKEKKAPAPPAGPYC
jgi:hypothetical protein